MTQRKEFFSMSDKTSVIFNNPMTKKVIKGAEKSKKKYIKKFGDDSKADYKISFKDIPTLDFINASNIVLANKIKSLKITL